MKNLTAVDINQTFLVTIMLASIATALTLLIARFARWLQLKYRKTNL